MVFVFMGNGGPLLAKQQEETSQKRLVLEMNGHADAILASAKNLDFNSSKNKGDPKYDAAQIRNYAGKLKEAMASIYGASPASSEKFKAIAENAEKMLRNVPDDPPTAMLYAEKLQKAVAALKESDVPAFKARKEAEKKTGKESKLDMQKAIEVIPIDTMEGMRRLVHSLNENSGSDIRIKGLNRTPGQEQVAYTESVDVLSSSGLITPSQKYLITEMGKNLFSEGGKHQFSEEQAKLQTFIAIMTAHLDRKTVNLVADYLASLPEGQRSVALWDPGRATSDAADKVFEILKGTGRTVTSKDRDYWEVIGYAIAHKIDVPTLKIKEIKAAIAEERLALKEGKYEEMKQRPVRLGPGEMWAHPKEQMLKRMPAPPEVEAAKANDKSDERPAEANKTGGQKSNAAPKTQEDLLGAKTRGAVLDFRDRRMAQNKERLDKEYLASEKARAQREASAKEKSKPAQPEETAVAPPRNEEITRLPIRGMAPGKLRAYPKELTPVPAAPNVEAADANDKKRQAKTQGNKDDDLSGEYIPVSRVIMPKKNKTIKEDRGTGDQEKVGGNEEARPKSIFKVYPEFSGKEMKSGIGWVDNLWADENFVKRFGSKELSEDPEVRKAAVEKFVDYVKDKDNRSTYQEMEPKDGGVLTKADMLMKILDSFRE